MRIRVSGFPTILHKYKLKRIFSELGTVTDVQKERGKSIAYLTMPYDYQARKAVRSLDGTKILGRTIRVEECL